MSSVSRPEAAATTAAAPSRRRHISHRGPRTLRHPTYRRVLLANLFSFPARFADHTIVAWLVVERTDSPLLVTLVGFFRFAPYLFAGPMMGLVADRFPRIRILRAAEATLALSSAALAALLLAGWLELWHIYVYVLVVGTAWGIAGMARKAYIVSVAGRRNMTGALALDMLAWGGSNIVASNLAGALLSDVRPAYLYVWLTTSYVISISIMRGLPVLWRPEPGGREPFMRSLAEGFRYVRRSRFMMGGVAVVALTNMFLYVHEVMAPVFAEDVLGVGAFGLGLLLSGSAIGSLGMGSYLATRRRLARPGLWLMLAAAGMGLLTIVWSFMTWYPASFAMLIAIGFVSMLFSTMNASVFIGGTPDRFVGRVQGVQMLVIGAFPIGSVVVGALGNWLGPGLAVRVMALSGLALLGLVFVAFPELRRPVGEVRR